MKKLLVLQLSAARLWHASSRSLICLGASALVLQLSAARLWLHAQIASPAGEADSCVPKQQQAGLEDQTWRSSSAQWGSRSVRLRILPVGALGSSSTKATDRGF